MPKLVIDGAEIEVEDGITLLQACEEAGKEIPRFCFHERLSIAGNCRMCLVEVAGMPKPAASCAMSVNDLRPGRDGSPPQIHTNSEMVRKAREGVMEFLLINHPLDCPICDQGGECDLQDQAMAYGIDSTRYHENKRAVEDKHVGPLIKTIMTRCIHCTRCVRFMTEVAGVEELGAIGRGEDMEITTYLEAGLSSELQGNVIDLCPVGALTSKPYAFQARPWELRKTESIDVMDAVGSNIRIDARGREVMRFLPRNNDAVNEEWISDKTRFCWDGLARQRLDQPYLRDLANGERGKLRPVSWSKALSVVGERLASCRPERMAALAGDLAGVEEMFALKQLFTKLGSANIDCRQDGAMLDPASGRDGYLFNAGIEGIDEADAILLIGTNPRNEAAILNARIRKRYRANEAIAIGVIGERVDLTYPYQYLGAGPQTLRDVASGAIKFLGEMRKSGAERPLVIVGQGALARPDGPAVLGEVARIARDNGFIDRAKGWNGFAVLHTAAARVGGLDIGFVPGRNGLDRNAILRAAGGGELDLVYLLGADEIDPAQFGETFVIYQGSHGDEGAHAADVILPGAAYTEKSATYVNLEGRVQMTQRAVFPPGEAKEDWAIVRALSECAGAKLAFDTLSELRVQLYGERPHLAQIDLRPEPAFDAIESLAAQTGEMSEAPFVAAISDLYLTNPIARASSVMAELSALRASTAEGATGTHG